MTLESDIEPFMFWREWPCRHSQPCIFVYLIIQDIILGMLTRLVVMCARREGDGGCLRRLHSLNWLYKHIHGKLIHICSFHNTWSNNINSTSSDILCTKQLTPNMVRIDKSELLLLIRSHLLVSFVHPKTHDHILYYNQNLNTFITHWGTFQTCAHLIQVSRYPQF